MSFSPLSVKFATSVCSWLGSPGVRTPPELSKVLCESCKSYENFLGGGGWRWGGFSDQPLCHQMPNCNWRSLSGLTSTSGSFAHRPTPRLCPCTSVENFHPRTPDLDPLNLQTRLLHCVTMLTTRRATSTSWATWWNVQLLLLCPPEIRSWQRHCIWGLPRNISAVLCKFHW